MIVFDLSTVPPTCLPEDLYHKTLVDITKIGDGYRVFFDPETGETHDGEDYAKGVIPGGGNG